MVSIIVFVGLRIFLVASGLLPYTHSDVVSFTITGSHMLLLAEHSWSFGDGNNPGSKGPNLEAYYRSPRCPKSYTSHDFRLRIPSYLGT